MENALIKNMKLMQVGVGDVVQNEEEKFTEAIISFNDSLLAEDEVVSIASETISDSTIMKDQVGFGIDSIIGTDNLNVSQLVHGEDTKLRYDAPNTTNLGENTFKQVQDFLTPNRYSKLSIQLDTQEYDLGFLKSRFAVYKKIDSIQDIFEKDYNKAVVRAVVVRVGSTFLSNLKLMTKDVYFDLEFREDSYYNENFLLNSVRLTSNLSEWQNVAMDIDDLNLHKLNISVVNTKDWYVSYNISNEITGIEMDFIKNACLLEFEFVDKYDSSNKYISKKKLLIGK